MKTDKRREILNTLLSKYYCNCAEGRHGKVGEDVRNVLAELDKLVLSEEEIITVNCINYTGRPCPQCEEYSGCVVRAKAIDLR